MQLSANYGSPMVLGLDPSGITGLNGYKQRDASAAKRAACEARSAAQQAYRPRAQAVTPFVQTNSATRAAALKAAEAFTRADYRALLRKELDLRNQVQEDRKKNTDREQARLASERVIGHFPPKQAPSPSAIAERRAEQKRLKHLIAEIESDIRRG